MISSKSLSWQLQIYYALLLLLALGTLTGLAIHWMRESEKHRYDSLLREYQHRLMPTLKGEDARDPGHWKVFVPRDDEAFPRRGPRGSDRPHRRPSTDHSPSPRRGRPDRPDFDGRPDRPPGPPPNRGSRRRDHPPGAPSQLLDQLLGEGWYFGLVSSAGKPLRMSRNFPEEVPLSYDASLGKEDLILEEGAFRHLVHREPGDTVSIIGYPKSRLTAYTGKRQWMIIGISSLLFFVAVILGSFLIRRALRPITDIRKTADKIAHGSLAERIDETAQPRNELRDLSENLNQSFSQLESMFARQQRFTSDASHELRTPIAVILGYCQMALEKDRSPEQIRAAVQACRRAGERMKNLTNDLLELSRIESGEISFVFTNCSIQDIAEEALELVEPLATEKGVILCDELTDVELTANADRLWQVLVNLLNNAIRHTPAGNTITLKSEIVGNTLKLSIIDEGEGIPKADLPRIFDRFYRVDHSRNRKKGGSGLGLAISETIVKAHGGSITVESEVGAGATFTITLPL